LAQGRIGACICLVAPMAPVILCEAQQGMTFDTNADGSDDTSYFYEATFIPQARHLDIENMKTETLDRYVGMMKDTAQQLIEFAKKKRQAQKEQPDDASPKQHGLEKEQAEKSLELDILFSEHNGYISKGDDLLKATMTVAQARHVASQLPGCQGFCFCGAPTDGPVEILFKGKWNNSRGKRQWTSYRREDAPKSAVDAIEKARAAGGCNNPKPLLKYIFAKHPPKNGGQLDPWVNSKTDIPKPIFMRMMRDYHPDKLPKNATSEDQLLYGEIAKHLNSFYETSYKQVGSFRAAGGSF